MHLNHDTLTLGNVKPRTNISKIDLKFQKATFLRQGV